MPNTLCLRLTILSNVNCLSHSINSSKYCMMSPFIPSTSIHLTLAQDGLPDFKSFLGRESNSSSILSCLVSDISRSGVQSTPLTWYLPTFLLIDTNIVDYNSCTLLKNSSSIWLEGFFVDFRICSCERFGEMSRTWGLQKGWSFIGCDDSRTNFCCHSFPLSNAKYF